MPAPITTLAIALAAQLSTALGVTVERRYAPYLDAAQLVTAKWILLAAGDERVTPGRGVEVDELTVHVALQIAMPDVDDRDDEYLDNLPFLDEQMNAVEQLKALYRPGGALRSVDVAGCEFRRLRNTPIYRPELLLDDGIFTSVVELVYSFDANDD